MNVDPRRVIEAMEFEKRTGLTIKSPELIQAARELGRFHRTGNRAMRRQAQRRSGR